MTAPETQLAPIPSAAEQSALTIRREKVLKLCIRIVAVAAILYAIGAFLSPFYRITISFTSSLPARVWLLHIGQEPHRGDTIAFRIPENRFYPSEHGGFLKIVRGMAGDQVSRDGRSILVNGEFVGIAKTYALNGLPLNPGPTGTIPPGSYFVWTPDVNSFDSRYEDIGWVTRDRILGVARPLF